MINPYQTRVSGTHQQTSPAGAVPRSRPLLGEGRLRQTSPFRIGIGLSYRTEGPWLS